MDSSLLDRYFKFVFIFWGFKTSLGRVYRFRNGRDFDDRKSILGFLFTFAGGTVPWQFKLQKCVALSTTDAEYIAAIEAGKEMLWMKWFLQELDLKQDEYVVY